MITSRYYIFLDDVRTPGMVHNADSGWGASFGDTYPWVMARNYEEFVNVLNERGYPEGVSFDNDLGEDWEGYDCAKYLVDVALDNCYPLPKYYVHSSNPCARENILGLFNSYTKFLANV